MQQHLEHIEQIEAKLNLLSSKIKGLRKENETLQKELLKKHAEIEAMKIKSSELEMRLGLKTDDGDENAVGSRATLEKKINEYIKEIDRCISLLGDQD
jgi:predicted nuclease with TOPRIM domain